MDKRTIIENYDLVSLAIDEIVDDGISEWHRSRWCRHPKLIPV